MVEPVDRTLKTDIETLLSFVVDSKPNWPQTATPGMYEPGDEHAPFFSEAFLYNLLGKDDARSLRARLRMVLRHFDGIHSDRF